MGATHTPSQSPTQLLHVHALYALPMLFEIFEGAVIEGEYLWLLHCCTVVVMLCTIDSQAQ